MSPRCDVRIGTRRRCKLAAGHTIEHMFDGTVQDDSVAASATGPQDAREKISVAEYDGTERSPAGQALLNEAQNARAIKREKDPEWPVLIFVEAMDAAASMLDAESPTTAGRLRRGINFLLNTSARAGGLAHRERTREIIESLRAAPAPVERPELEALERLVTKWLGEARTPNRERASNLADAMIRSCAIELSEALAHLRSTPAREPAKMPLSVEGDRWRKKPVEVDAWRWLFSPKQAGAPAWVTDALFRWPEIGGLDFRPDHSAGPRIRIATLDAEAIALPGDWIIRGTAGELYPCKPDIFAATYERAAPARREDAGQGEGE